MSIYVAPQPAAKAASGIGLNYYLTDPPLSAIRQTPQQRMKRALQLGVSVPWIRAAERVITGLGSTVPWHLEDADDVEVDDEYQGLEAQRARMLLEKPQELLSTGGKMTRREMWAVTLRHTGLCGISYWVEDQPDPDNLPGALLYVRPDRMTMVPDAQGNLVGFVVDADNRGGGIPLTLDEVIIFRLEPADEGLYPAGLVESALLKANISGALDNYLLTKVSSGGRKAGILGPKEGVIPPDVYEQMITDWRVASEGNDSARRLQVVRAPVDFIDTGMDELTTLLRDFMTGSRDDLLGLWGVPASKLGLHDRGKGLGATAATSADDETLWENAIKPRLEAFTETVQYQLLDDWQKIGVTLELELTTPDFGDDKPQYDKAQAAVGQPLTNNDRRAILGYDPLPDYGPNGEPLGLAIYMPYTAVLIGQAPDAQGNFGTPIPPAAPPQLPVVKAKLTPRHLREQVQRTSTPKLKRDVASFLGEQKRAVVAWLRANPSNPTRLLKDAGWWRKWDAKLQDALKPHLARMAQTVSDHVTESLPGKAGPVDAVQRALTRGAARVTKINETTRDRIAELIATGVEQGEDVLTVADALESEAIFDEYRAELIARTELMDAYNGAAIGAYSDAGISQVEAIDGDGDPECAERDGQIFSVEEADSIEDHPNGTLDWAPVTESIGKAMLSRLDTLVSLNQSRQPIINNYVSAPDVRVQAPDVHVSSPEIHSPVTIAKGAIEVNVESKPTRKRVERDEAGRITATVEEPA